jgi:hypothetical protein
MDAFNHLFRKINRLRLGQLRSVNIRSVHIRKINSIRPRELPSSLPIDTVHIRLNNIRENRHGSRPVLTLMLRLSVARQSSQEQDLRRVGNLSSRSNAHRGVAGPRGPRVPRVRSVPAHARADGCDCESAAAVVGRGGVGFFEAQDDFDCFFVFDDFGVSVGEKEVLVLLLLL